MVLKLIVFRSSKASVYSCARDHPKNAPASAVNGFLAGAFLFTIENKINKLLGYKSTIVKLTLLTELFQNNKLCKICVSLAG